MTATTATFSDRRLWELACAGDHDAFGQLFDRHARTIYNFLFRRTTSWSDAEDLTSAVFLHAWRRRSEVILDRESALPWLLKVADYTARNEWRSRLRYRNAIARIRHVDGHADQADHADQVAGRVDDERRAGEVRRALRRLPRVERELIELCYWTGLDQRAAAVALGIPVGTVKSRLSRARKNLRGLIADAPESLENPS